MDGPPPVDPELTARVHEYRATLAALLDEDLARTSAQAPMADCGSLGVVVVTSPLPMHPTTLLIELTIATYLQRCPALERHAVPIVIVCDGHRPRIDEKSRFKRGAISEEEAARYEQYVAELRQLSARATWPLINCRVVAQTSRVGFAFCVKRGLEELGKPYALVVQHDRPISNTVDLDDLVATLDAHRDIRYINLATRSSLMVSRKHRVLRLPDRQTVQGLRLAPTPFFYDSSHVVRVDWYLRVVYGWHAVALGSRFQKPFRLRNGDFPEDTIGQALMGAIRNSADPVQEHRLYGFFVLSDEATVYVRHCHGRKIRLDALQRIRKREIDELLSSEEGDEDDGGGGGGGD